MILQQEIVFDNGDSPEHTLVFVGCENRPGLLSDITSALKQMDIRCALPSVQRTCTCTCAAPALLCPALPLCLGRLHGGCPHTHSRPAALLAAAATRRCPHPTRRACAACSPELGLRSTRHCGGCWWRGALRRKLAFWLCVAHSVKDAQIKTSGDKVMDVFTVARKEGGQLPETSWSDVRAGLSSVVGSDPTASDDEIYFQVCVCVLCDPFTHTSPDRVPLPCLCACSCAVAGGGGG